ncbi:MAG: putative beta-lysine N-acetyltransferase [Candidatus Omnitrophica bacterium]|nr:putative beta-lysine N-acetyltransferase [Candidatus Omnitrophota bacterium]
MRNDRIEKIGSSVIQHGKMNDRIYLMKLDEKDLPGIIGRLDSLAVSRGYSKIFAKVPFTSLPFFLDNGYAEEARVPGFYGGSVDGSFLGKYFSGERERNDDASEVEEVLRLCREKAQAPEPGYGGEIVFRKAGPSDIPDMGRIYSEVFKSYPFPIHDPRYLLETMKTHVNYFVACDGEKVIGVSSSETDSASGNAEMTDFATLPEYRGRGVAGGLLAFMDERAGEEGFFTAYTIARALSRGMNITFARNGYTFAGTLVNNTNIAGSIESMNVWYKRLKGERVKG